MTTEVHFENHGRKLAEAVSSLLEGNTAITKFSDIQVIVGTRTFYCHKLVLQLSSDYFADASLSSATVILPDINEDDFLNVLRFIYTGKIQLGLENIESVLFTANTLCMNDLKQVCFNFLEDTLTADNATQCWYLADKYGHSEHGLKCQNRAIEYFNNFKSVPTDAPEDMIKVILNDDNLEVESEVKVCEILIKWINETKDGARQIHLDKLLAFIRWSGISVEYIKSTLLQNKTLTSDAASMFLMSKVLTYLLTGIQFEGLRTFHRPSTGFENCVLAIGLGDGDRVSQELCRIRLQKLDSSPTTIDRYKIPTKMSVGSKACMINNSVYVTGTGKRPYNQTWKLDPLAGWIRCADMLTGRLVHGVAVVDSMLYILGGGVEAENAAAVSSIEVYNTMKNKWSSAGDLIHAVYCAACVTYKNSIYTFGGLNINDEEIDHVQVYSPVQQSCSVLDKPMPHSDWALRAVLWDATVILMGRYNCFVYNFETQCWQELEQFKTNVAYFGLVVDNQTVYVLGGGTSVKDKYGKEIWTCTDEIKGVRVKDILEDKQVSWTHYAKLLKLAMIHTYCLITQATQS